jgi:sulfide:quinone oxidoreductase
VDFCLAGDALFGVAYFRPALQQAVDYYGINLQYKHNLIAVNGPERKATFAVTGPDGKVTKVVREFDMLHVTPPQSAPDFVKKSPLADAAGWLDVNATTLQHAKYPTIFGIGDVMNTSNAKTMAAARAQTPVVVRNVLASLDGRPLSGQYDGYGACPLTVAYGKIVLAEFLYGGKPAPSFPYDQRKPSRFAWFLKTTVFPHVYWDMMLKGRDIEMPHHPEWSKD